MGKHGQKRPREEATQEDGTCGSFGLRAPAELSAREAAVVGSALERWSRLRLQADALRPVLETEDRLMQEILDHGLGSEDRKKLRKLASGGGEAEEEARQVGLALGSERDRLQDILSRNQRELLELSTVAAPDSKKELLAEMDAVLDDLRRAQDSAHADLLAAKKQECVDMAIVRAAGRSLNELKALTRKLDNEKRGLTKNSCLASLLVTVLRKVLPSRQIDPAALGEIVPSHEGYLQILDFYFFSDAGLYCFGEHYSGPNWFTRLKRNVAIFRVHDKSGKLLYNNFAVSGEHKTPGAPLAPLTGPLESIEAEDEHGRVFDRRHDAEFKLLTGFSTLIGGEQAAAVCDAKASLWTKKPLCRSCAGAVRQVQRRFPRLRLEILVGDGLAAEVSEALCSPAFCQGLACAAPSITLAPAAAAKDERALPGAVECSADAASEL